jgi:GTPase SAR1 family protein
VSNKSSFGNVTSWFEDLRTLSSNNIIITLVANKIDMIDERQVKKSEGEELASKMNAYFVETSTKESINIDEVCAYLVLL